MANLSYNALRASLLCGRLIRCREVEDAYSALMDEKRASVTAGDSSSGRPQQSGHVSWQHEQQQHQQQHQQLHQLQGKDQGQGRDEINELDSRFETMVGGGIGTAMPRHFGVVSPEEQREELQERAALIELYKVQPRAHGKRCRHSFA